MERFFFLFFQSTVLVDRMAFLMRDLNSENPIRFFCSATSRPPKKYQGFAGKVFVRNCWVCVGNVVMFVGEKECSSKAPTGEGKNTFWKIKNIFLISYPLGIFVNNQICDARFSTWMVALGTTRHP